MNKETENRIRQNVSETRKGNNATRYGQKTISDKAAKMNRQNFYKLMQRRNISRSDAQQTWDSFSHKSPVMAKHASKGEKFIVTSGDKRASGIYVSKKSLGKNPKQRINNGALPVSNTATNEKYVKLARDQNILYGKIASQKQFQKNDPNHLPRRGGAYQTVTDGGYKANAIQTIPSRKKTNYADKAKAVNSNFVSKTSKSVRAKNSSKQNTHTNKQCRQ